MLEYFAEYIAEFLVSNCIKDFSTKMWTRRVIFINMIQRRNGLKKKLGNLSLEHYISLIHDLKA